MDPFRIHGNSSQEVLFIVPDLTLTQLKSPLKKQERNYYLEDVNSG